MYDQSLVLSIEKHWHLKRMLGRDSFCQSEVRGGTHLLYLTHLPWFIMKCIPEQPQIPKCVSCMLQQKLKSNDSCIVTVVILT